MSGVLHFARSVLTFRARTSGNPRETALTLRSLAGYGRPSYAGRTP
ncbi:hypothetical protein DB32_005044 [Sandaracinus amylolyticus]|uniref:Uncharacterized protein n=1 Tax=Sandaracinus amylolyticus TaxID=927083 RepID=A0A0F6YL48_9BACT|nr:hypothetical protein DB32_005044 [Sandaracinus amylolyticus]